MEEKEFFPCEWEIIEVGRASISQKIIRTEKYGREGGKEKRERMKDERNNERGKRRKG